MNSQRNASSNNSPEALSEGLCPQQLHPLMLFSGEAMPLPAHSTEQSFPDRLRPLSAVLLSGSAACPHVSICSIHDF